MIPIFASAAFTKATWIERMKGKIASWNDSKGYGFIAPLDGGEARGVANQRKRPPHVGSSGRLAGRIVCTGVITSQVEEDVFSCRFLGHGVRELQCACLATYGGRKSGFARLFTLKRTCPRQTPAHRYSVTTSARSSKTPSTQ